MRVCGFSLRGSISKSLIAPSYNLLNSPQIIALAPLILKGRTEESYGLEINLFSSLKTGDTPKKPNTYVWGLESFKGSVGLLM